MRSITRKSIIKNRTAMDYASEYELKQALSPDENLTPSDWDWTVDNAPSDYDTQSIDQEVKRLMVLKSYMALGFQDMSDAERSTFQGFATMAKQSCQGKAGLITLVDLGRQWFLANSENAENPGEKPRKNGFCAHAILNPDPILVVNDASQDPRFMDNELVTDHGLRFYAGVPLITPEGFKLGALCITDSSPRPQGLSAMEESQLKMLAQLTVNTLISHRTMCEQQAQLEQTRRTSAVAAHHLVTPLTGAQLALSLLAEDEDLLTKMNQEQRDNLATAQSCTSSVQQSCHTLRRSGSMPALDSSDLCDLTQATEDTTETSYYSATDLDVVDCCLSTTTQSSAPPQAASSSGTLVLSNLKQRLQTALQEDNSVPVSIYVSPKLQEVLNAKRATIQEATVFRAAFCLAATVRPKAKGGVRLQLKQSRDKRRLVVETTHSGAACQSEEFEQLVQEQQPFEADEEDVDAFADWETVAMRIRSMGGRAGIRSFCTSAAARSNHMNKFFFEIPLMIGGSSSSNAVAAATAQHTTMPLCSLHPSCSGSNLMGYRRTRSAITLQRVTNTRRALVIDDCGMIRKMLANALTRLGYEQVIQACDGQEGVRCMQQNMFEVVFCDFLMPCMDGMDCIRTYRAWEKVHRPKGFRQYVVGISAHASSEDVARARQMGMDAYRDKPLKFAELKELTQRLRGRGALLGASSSSSLEPASKRNWSPPEASIQSTTSTPATTKVSCLVITANKTTRTRIKASLAQQKQVHTCHAQNKKEGLDFLKSRNWTLVLLDGDGLQLLDCIREFREWEKSNRVCRQHNIRLLVGGDGRQEPVLPVGVDGALRRPVNDERFHQLLVDALDASASSYASERNVFRPLDIVTR